MIENLKRKLSLKMNQPHQPVGILKMGQSQSQPGFESTPYTPNSQKDTGLNNLVASQKMNASLKSTDLRLSWNISQSMIFLNLILV
jgi:hypothetical protein